MKEPRIYFGERSSDYVVVGAKPAEFDYPTGEGDDSAASGAETRWTGTTGVKIDSTLMRLLFALRFRDLDLLISDQVTGNSQLLFHRSLTDRVSRVAPFLVVVQERAIRLRRSRKRPVEQQLAVGRSPGR